MTSDQFPRGEIHLPARRRKRAAPDWSRRPATPAPRVKHGEISQLLAERNFAARIARLDPTPRNRCADLAAYEALGEARWRAAREFGGAHYWSLARSGFMIGELCARERGCRYPDLHPDYSLVDHPTLYRWAIGPHNRQPAALVAQPYKAAFKLDRAQAFADEHGLTVSVAEGFESWYWPGACVIVVWKRGCLPPQTRGRPDGAEDCALGRRDLGTEGEAVMGRALMPVLICPFERA